MIFTAQTDEEIAQGRLLKKGIYSAVIVSSTENDINGNPLKTKNGTGMLNLTLEIYDNSGKLHINRTMITPDFMKKFKNAFIAAGLEKEYESENVSAEIFNNKSVLVSVDIGKYISKKTKKEVVVNEITDYIKPDLSHKKIEIPDKPFDDDIPF